MVATTWVGRVWGVGAGYAPSPTIIRQPISTASATTSAEKARQLWSGSAPTSSSTSLPSGSVPAFISMDGQVRPVWMPSSMCIVGRRARWSSSVSVSNTATVSSGMSGVSASSAEAAPRPASIQPSSTTTRTGESSSGFWMKS